VYTKPIILAVFEKGKIIDAIDGVVDTLNWIVSWVSNFKIGNGLILKKANAGTPTLELDIVDGKGTRITDTDDGSKRIDLALVGGEGVTISDYGENEKKIEIDGFESNVTISGNSGSHTGNSFNIIGGSGASISTEMSDSSLSINVYYM